MGKEGKESAIEARQEVLRRQRNAVLSWNLLRKKLIEGRFFIVPNIGLVCVGVFLFTQNGTFLEKPLVKSLWFRGMP